MEVDLICLGNGIGDKDMTDRIIKTEYLFNQCIIYAHNIALLNDCTAGVIVHNMCT